MKLAILIAVCLIWLIGVLIVLLRPVRCEVRPTRGASSVPEDTQ